MSSQAEWDTYATNIAGKWNLCANCAPDMAGKKLFRQYQFNRLMMGLGQLTSPVDDTEYAPAMNGDVDYVDIDGGRYMAVSLDPAEIDELGIYQLGAVLANPWYIIPEEDRSNALTSGPTYDFFVGLITSNLPEPGEDGFSNLTVTVCTATETGAPGLKATINLGWFQ